MPFKSYPTVFIELSLRVGPWVLVLTHCFSVICENITINHYYIADNYILDYAYIFYCRL